MIPIIQKKCFEFKTAQELKDYINYQQRDATEKFLDQEYQEIERLEETLEFQLYDGKKPVVICNLDRDWGNWNWNYLKQTYSQYYFRVSMDDDGNYLKLKFSEYLQYMQNTKDYNPLYIFDGDIPQEMLQQYQVPKLFPQDYLQYIQEKRPLYRWILCGYSHINISPKQSGSMMHVDPYETSAWNCVVLGKKRWVMFPPQTDRKLLLGKYFMDKEQLKLINNPLDYFYQLVPKIKEYCKQQSIQYYDFIQHEHETVYVPNGWWHAVLNIEDCVAVTQNFVGDANFDQFWKAFNKENPGLSKLFYKTIEIENKELFKRAQQLNEEYHINYNQFEDNNEDQTSEQDSLEDFQNQYD